MSKSRYNSLLFSVGALGYGIIEILWRGFTHWSMLCAGGISFLGLTFISEKMKKFSIFFKCAAGGMFITAVELIFGLFFNIFLKMNIWDYSRLPFNFRGQICVRYSVLWMLLCRAAIPLSASVSSRLKKYA